MRSTPSREGFYKAGKYLKATGAGEDLRYLALKWQYKF
jgi:hypothetical protein